MAILPTVLSHWNVLIEDLSLPPTEFYDCVRTAIERRKIPDIRVHNIELREARWLSSKRLYLKVFGMDDFFILICGAPYGTGFFVSSWLLRPEGCLAYLSRRFPFAAGVVEFLIRPWSFYNVDTATMFRTATHAAVLEAIDSVTKTKGLPLLADSERKPLMNEFFSK